MSDEKVYSEEEIHGKLSELPGWELRGYHHPDLESGWARVVVRLQTHSAGGITDKDFSLAREIEKLSTWTPGEDSALEGFPKKWIR